MTEQIWKEFNEQLLGFIKVRVADEEIAKDILQEVFIKIHQGINSIKNRGKITSWVYQITRNAIIDFYRKRKEKVTEPFLPEKIESHNADFAKCIIPFMSQLSNNDQDILKKISFENVSQKDYARQHNLSYSAAKSRIQRAREKLKAAFVECCNVQSDKYGNIISSSEDKCGC